MRPKVGGCLLLSAVLHGAAFCLPAQLVHRQPIALEVTIKARPVARKLNLLPVKQPPRLGSEIYRQTRRNIGQIALAENYLERLHAHIDPNWIRFVNLTGLRVACSTTLNIDADRLGTVLTVYSVYSTCPAKLRQAAKDAILYCNLLPPPKQLLDKSSMLRLEWTFILKPKDD